MILFLRWPPDVFKKMSLLILSEWDEIIKNIKNENEIKLLFYVWACFSRGVSDKLERFPKDIDFSKLHWQHVILCPWTALKQSKSKYRSNLKIIIKLDEWAYLSDIINKAFLRPVCAALTWYWTNEIIFADILCVFLHYSE